MIHMFQTLMAIGLASVAVSALAQQPGAADEFVNLSPAELRFESVPGIPGASYAALFGNPEESGSYIFHPKGAVHFDGSCTAQPIEVQVTGMGPVSTVWFVRPEAN